MSKVKVNNVEIFYQSEGDGPETILFSHGYLADHTMFEPQIKALKADFRCVTYDHRGHGQSEVTKGGYELDNLVTDAISLIENLKIGPVHFVGVSVGGMVGMRIALRRPDLLRSLTLVDTSAEAEPEQAVPRIATISGRVITFKAAFVPPSGEHMESSFCSSIGWP